MRSNLEDIQLLSPPGTTSAQREVLFRVACRFADSVDSRTVKHSVVHVEAGLRVVLHRTPAGRVVAHLLGVVGD